VTPLFFGSADHRLYGVYSPARGTGSRARSVVMCYPWGQEYLRAHRSMRVLDRQLSAAGCHVLRFDYFGTGDSAGTMVEASCACWEKDIELAIEELKDTSGLPKVTLVGLRLGGLLAARVAVRRPRDVDALLLWDPVMEGTGYLDELTRAETMRRGGKPPQSRAGAQGGGREILGFPLTDALETELRTLDLSAALQAVRARTSVLVSSTAEAADALRRVLDAAPATDKRVEHVPGEAAWVSDPLLGAGAVPVKLLQQIVGWAA
jgi:pimeloyl-ACP methyl ester carboxylesterase